MTSLVVNTGFPYFFFLYNPGYFLSIAFFAPASAFLTPAGDTRSCIALTAAGPVSGLDIGFLAAGFADGLSLIISAGLIRRTLNGFVIDGSFGLAVVLATGFFFIIAISTYTSCLTYRTCDTFLAFLLALFLTCLLSSCLSSLLSSWRVTNSSGCTLCCCLLFLYLLNSNTTSSSTLAI
jgi:hypothetical protein